MVVLEVIVFDFNGFQKCSKKKVSKKGHYACDGDRFRYKGPDTECVNIGITIICVDFFMFV